MKTRFPDAWEFGKANPDVTHYVSLTAFWTACDLAVPAPWLNSSSRDWRKVTCPRCLTQAQVFLTEQITRAEREFKDTRARLRDLRAQLKAVVPEVQS